MDSLMEYSLNTPIGNYENILNSKILNIIKNNNMVGGSNDNSNCIIIIIGIVIIIVGFYLCSCNNDWISTEAQIQNTSCDKTKCKINITYTANTIQYSKTISMDKSNIPSSSTITIYYQESNPNIMRLYNFNYSIIGVVLITLGFVVLISSIYCINKLSNSSTNIESESNLYTNTRNSDGINIVYTK